MRLATLLPAALGGGCSFASAVADTEAPTCRLAVTFANESQLPIAVCRQLQAEQLYSSSAAAASSEQQRRQQPRCCSTSKEEAESAIAVWPVVPASGQLIVPPQTALTAVFELDRLRSVD